MGEIRIRASLTLLGRHVAVLIILERYEKQKWRSGSSDIGVSVWILQGCIHNT